MEQNRQTKLPTNRLKALLRNRKARLAALPALILATAFTITYAAQAASDTSPKSGEASSVQPAKEQGAKAMDEQDAKAPKTTESVTDDGSGATTNVTVNGETITVPENGSYHRSTDDGGTQTEIHVDNRNQSSTSGNGSSNSSSSKIEVNVQSNSSSESISN